MLKLIPEVKKLELLNNERNEFKHIALGENLLDQEAENDFLEFCSKPGGNANILFELDMNLEKEAYSISISDTVLIKASSYIGQLYALQTLKQIFFQLDFKVMCLEIEDNPTYNLRGFMLDVGRYFYSVDKVKLMIRRMAMHKLNLLHFHLTEDQGWRIEIKKYPRLTEYGSIRKKTNFNNTPHSGFYTQQDIKEIVAYAHSFGIQVMPEFDIPGHSRAAIACYNDLTCFPRNLPVADHWGVKHDVLCVGKDSTMEFVKNVLDEFFELFPDKYIHIGGDEVPKHRWNLCPNCNARMKSLGLNKGDDLQIWFMNTVKDYCKAAGKQVFMWSWDLKSADKLDLDLGFTKCGELETGDRPFIDTDTQSYYIDLPYGYISLKDTAEHKPFSGNCLGVEVTLWTEYVPDMKRADYVTYPRTGAACESGWNGSCTWDKFAKKLDFYYSYLDKNNIGYAPVKAANPNLLNGKLESIWFERRQLTWQGLTNVLDDKHIEKIAKNMKKR